MTPETVVTVGTFDGVHLGHQKVLARLFEKARELDLASAVVTFDRHPLSVIRPQDAPPVLTTQVEKQQILAATDVDFIQILPFTRELAEFSPQQFVNDILIKQMGMKHLVIGYDHGFGKGRSGDVDTLKQIGADVGFGVDVVPPQDVGGVHVSSSRIRSLLLEGKIEEANAALGRPYGIRGHVVRGDGRGRELGVPTANLQVADPHKLLPLEGIYAVTVGELKGVLHLGPRPTFDGAKPSIEVHLFDFDNDIYNHTITVELRHRVRDVVRFDTIDELVSAMREDVRRARELLNRAP
ncbi:MAG TPA: bifunctional riboflavin kinase/FAD synthetase [Longimicrobiales bacterium]